MGSCWSMFKFSGKLKQPYKCIVHCGSSIFKAGLVLFIAGFILIYFFWASLHGESLWKRGLAVTGIVLTTVAVVLVIFSMIICIFYIRLYKVHEGRLQEISIFDVRNNNSLSSWSPPNYSERNSPNSPLPPIWHTQQTPYMFTPSAPPQTQAGATRPDVYRLPWSTFTTSTSGRNSPDGKTGSESPRSAK